MLRSLSATAAVAAIALVPVLGFTSPAGGATGGLEGNRENWPQELELAVMSSVAPNIVPSGMPNPDWSSAALPNIGLPAVTSAPENLVNPLQTLLPTAAAQLSDEPSAMPECSGQEILEASNCAGDGEEPEEAKLHQLVNQYRAAYDLPPIARSPSLDLLANRHVLDIARNISYLTHSWSDCPYDPNDRTTLSCSSRAPQRLGTRYPGKAYENAHYHSRGATAASALRGWQNSPPHNALIINLNNWRDNEWKAMGLGIYRQYAVLWVGEARDPETNPVASSDPKIRQAALARPEPEPDRSPRRVFRLPSLRLRIP